MNFRKLIHLSLYIVTTLVGMTSLNAWAGCVLTTPALVLNIPAAVLSPSQKGAAGTVLMSTRIQAPSVGYTCGNGVKSTWRSAYQRSEMSKSAIENVYNTSIPGIGVRIKWPEGRAQNAWVPGAYSCQGSCIESADKILVEFVQTGVASSGSISAGNIVEVSVSPDNDPQNRLVLMTIVLGEITVNIRSCAIYASTNSVDLGEYLLADIQKTGFQGDKKDFTIMLDCPDPTSAKITFEGKNAWGMSSGILENTGDAKNAYVKLYQKSGQRYSEKALNTLTDFGSATAFTGVRGVTYAGEMYFDDSTRSNVTSGSVKADIIYTLRIN